MRRDGDGNGYIVFGGISEAGKSRIQITICGLSVLVLYSLPASPGYTWYVAGYDSLLRVAAKCQRSGITVPIRLAQYNKQP